jgi:outer membrane protein
VIRTYRALLTGSLMAWALSGCAQAPIRMGGDSVEAPLQQTTGVSTESLKESSQKAQLDLWDVYGLAVKRTEDMASKYEDILQARAQSQQAVASVLPQIFLNGSKGWQSSSFVGGAGSSFSSVPSTSLYLSGAETILTGLNQVAALQGAKAQEDENRHLFRQEARNLLLNVAKSFYGALQAQANLESKRSVQGLTEQILKQEQQWRAIGRSRESDVLSVEAQLAQLNADLENSQNQLTQARENLSLLAGIPADQALQSAETVTAPGYTLEQAVAKVDQRPDVLAAKAAVDLADAQLLQAHGEHLPSLVLEGSYYLDKEGSAPSPEWTAQLVASLPLFEGGGILAQENLAASKKRQADLEYSLTRRQALEDIRQAYESLTSSIVQVDAYAKAQDAAQKDYDAVERDRRLALNTELDVLQALTSLQTAQNNYNQAKYQALVNWVWLGEATGELPKLSEGNP